MLTLIAPARDRGAALPDGYRLRPLDPAATEPLGRLYHAAYDPGIACDTVEEAVADVAATFDGDYGPLWAPGSLGVWAGDELAAAVMTVFPAPWDDTPRCPFVVELFTARAHRRRGLARALVAEVLAAAAVTEPAAVALRVAGDNEPARALYAGLGFAEWGR